jgi:acetate CoA/acetoacetate CoA-transferase beta subunit
MLDGKQLIKIKNIMDKNQIREFIAKRAAQEIKNDYVVNLGIGLPTLIPNYLSEDVKVTLQSENGMLGMGPAPDKGAEDINYTNAGGGYITYNIGASCFDSAMSFTIIRGGHVDITILGALEVDEKGNLANWMIPGKKTPGMGGAMDLIVGAKKVIIAMEHTAKGEPKILSKCKLPLTAAGQVDMIITEMGVMKISPQGIVLTEYNPEFTFDEIQKVTEAKLIIPEDIKKMNIQL